MVHTVMVGFTVLGVLGRALSAQEAIELSKRAHISMVESHGPLRGYNIHGQVFTNHQGHTAQQTFSPGIPILCDDSDSSRRHAHHL